MIYLQFFQIELNTEKGFTLLELIMVIGLIGLLSTTLGSLIIGQYDAWDFNLNQTKLNDHSELILAHLEKDIRRTIDFDENSLEFKLDVDGDSDIDKVVKYQLSGQELIKLTYLGSDTSNPIDSREIISDIVTSIDFNKIDEQELKVNIELSYEGQSRSIDKEYYISDLIYLEARNYSLLFDGVDDYVAVDNLTYQGADYSQLSIIAKVKTTDSDGVIYSFDKDNYFSLAIDNGRLKFNYTKWEEHILYDRLEQEAIISQRTINDGQEHIVAVSFINGVTRIYIDGVLDEENIDDSLGGFLGWFDDLLGGIISDLLALDFNLGSGELRYGFLGASSQADSFNGDKANGDFFSGNIYWLQHWDKTLTKQQIKLYSGIKIDGDTYVQEDRSLSGQEDGLLVYYPIRINDSILYDFANDNNGIVYGGHFE
ncbi:prepilin-type N-terminal cleavage/methylation domain-containing protein [Orenia marismortui]|uniref:Prepilin-type N-terminal cleavage/methylation domain-containing protein n=1 Tax=Orenia marismortui TaxID=46469 RepID=A0A4R8GSS4_9FIRM|nr:prepilin-type N-terminal cleavage/methylation domain-containing protein [Orenia marismortui]